MFVPDLWNHSINITWIETDDDDDWSESIIEVWKLLKTNVLIRANAFQLTTTIAWYMKLPFEWQPDSLSLLFPRRVILILRLVSWVFDYFDINKSRDCGKSFAICVWLDVQ